MKAFMMAIAALGMVVSPALANECPLLKAQIDKETGRRLDAGSNQAKDLANEAMVLHGAGKHAESIAKLEEAAKAAGMTLEHKK